jgi:hypothetical protein
MPKKLTTRVSTEKVAERFMREAMAVVLRNVIEHDWGFFSREDQRMHLQTVDEGSREGQKLQTVDEGSREGQKKAKVWLEERGRKICESADGKVTGADLRAKIEAEREHIEVMWISFMLKNDWITAKLKDSDIMLTAYPKSHNRYERVVNLREIFPGAFGGHGGWDQNPPKVEFDKTTGLLAVGTEDRLDDRNHLDVREFLFTG